MLIAKARARHASWYLLGLWLAGLSEAVALCRARWRRRR